ncbi:hypothetical protein DSO57_1029449 [Entomophthora muscae]|uniref:Uncharacterized protein n=2 Tax=Entomophthora muscae TaxID=34485 RepID=A0ACC2TN70_9FUNG|nr:hypothetical protein DSO57_1029449 [Entomophthora muscae]
MDAQEVVVDFLNKIPVHSHELGALAAELQNFLVPNMFGQGLHDNFSEEEAENIKSYDSVPPTPDMVHHLISKVCILLSTDEQPLWAASSAFLHRYILKLSKDQITRNTAQLVAYTLLASIQAKAAHQLRFMLENVNSALGVIYCLWKGPPESDSLGFLTTYDLIRLFQEITESGRVPVHFILHSLFNEVERERRSLSSLLLPPDGNYPVLAFPYTQLDAWRLRKQCDWMEIEQEAEHHRRTGYLESMTKHLDGLLYQNAPPHIIFQMVEESGLSLLEGLVKKVERVCRKIRCQFDFFTPRPDIDASDLNTSSMLAAPSDTSFFELLQELGEQIYMYVSQHKLLYSEIIDAFLELVEPKVGKPRIEKDNTLLWLILQLFHVEHLRTEIVNDFNTNEAQFQKLIRMYNHTQTESVDAYHLRDLALQCALIHQQESILDRSNLKTRLPGLVPALKYSQISYIMHNEFIKSRELIGQVTLFDPATPIEQVRLGVIGQMRQGQFPQSLFVNLMPGKSDYGRVVFADCTFVLGGIINYCTLDQLPVNSKQQLMDLFITMALNPDKPLPASTKALPPPTCVSPAMVDAIFRLVYSAPLALESYIQSLLGALKSHASPQLPGQMRWYATILQLISYRLVRHFSNHPSALLIECLPLPQVHPQLQLEAEDMTAAAINLLVSFEQLQALDCSRPFLLFGCRHLAHMLVLRIVELIKHASIGSHGDMIHTILARLPPLRLSNVTNFPSEVASFYLNAEHPAGPISLAQARDFLVAHGELHEPLIQGNHELNVAALVDLYILPGNQGYFLPMLWAVLLKHGSVTPHVVMLMRLTVPKLSSPSKYERTVHFLFAILPTINLSQSGFLLDELIFNHHVLMFHHVLFGLSCDGLLSDVPVRWDVINYLLLYSPSFKARYTFWEELNVSRYFWRETEYFKKHCHYLTNFPEPLQHPNSPGNSWTDANCPMPHMPSYFGNVVLRTISSLEYILNAWIGANQFDLLANFLLQYPHLLKHHQLPLTTVRNILAVHWDTAGFMYPLRLKLAQQLDPSQVPFSAQFLNYLTTGEITLSGAYFEQLVEGLVQAIDPISSPLPRSASVPERHFREFSNPIRHVLEAAIVELLCVPVDPTMITVVSSLSAVALSKRAPQTIHTIGLLLAHLPFNAILHLANDMAADTVFQAGLMNDITSNVFFGPFLLQRGFRLGTSLNTLLTLFHSILHFSTIESFKALPGIIDQLGADITTVSQINFIFSLVGPSLQRIVGTSLLDEMMLSLAKLVVLKGIESDSPLIFMDMIQHHHASACGPKLALLGQFLASQHQREPSNPALLRLFKLLGNDF